MTAKEADANDLEYAAERSTVRKNAWETTLARQESSSLPKANIRPASAD